MISDKHKQTDHVDLHSHKEQTEYLETMALIYSAHFLIQSIACF